MKYKIYIIIIFNINYMRVLKGTLAQKHVMKCMDKMNLQKVYVKL